MLSLAPVWMLVKSSSRRVTVSVNPANQNGKPRRKKDVLWIEREKKKKNVSSLWEGMSVKTMATYQWLPKAHTFSPHVPVINVWAQRVCSCRHVDVSHPKAMQSARAQDAVWTGVVDVIDRCLTLCDHMLACRTSTASSRCPANPLKLRVDKTLLDQWKVRHQQQAPRMAMSFFQRILDWFRSLFWKEEMELTLVGLQNSGKTTFVNVIAVSWTHSRLCRVGGSN